VPAAGRLTPQPGAFCFSGSSEGKEVAHWLPNRVDLQDQELDKKIEHYRSLVARVTDQLTNERVAKLIEEMQAQKAALHPEQEK